MDGSHESDGTYKRPCKLPPNVIATLDPREGFHCTSTYWQPNPDDPDPQMPGAKVSVLSYIPMRPSQVCLCGSGKPFRLCCRRTTGMHIVCPNPGAGGYSLYAPQSAIFEPVDSEAIRVCLMADRRLRCVEEGTEHGFWILWGDPPLETEYGILCFGDIELQEGQKLSVGALSNLRMRTLLALLAEIAGEYLGEPQMQHDPPLSAAATSLSRGSAQGQSKGKRRRRTK